MCDFGPFSLIGGLWRSTNHASGRFRGEAAHSTPFAAQHRASGRLRSIAAHSRPFAARPSRIGDPSRQAGDGGSRTGGPSRRDGTDPHVQTIAPGARVVRSPWPPARVSRAIPKGNGLERALVHRIQGEPKPRPTSI